MEKSRETVETYYWKYGVNMIKMVKELFLRNGNHSE